MIDSPSFHEGVVFSGLKTVRRNKAWWYTWLIVTEAKVLEACTNDYLSRIIYQPKELHK